MTKHLIDSDMWIDQAFMDASAHQKLLVVYMVSNCDCAGFFRFNPKVLSVILGFTVTAKEVLSAPVDVLQIEAYLFWLRNYCKHQYGPLRSTCRPHLPVFSLLARHNLLSLVEVDPDFDFSKVKRLPAGFSIDSLSIPYQYPINRVKEQEQEQEQEPYKVVIVEEIQNTEVPKRESAHVANPMPDLKRDFLIFWNAYPKRINQALAWKAWEEKAREGRLPPVQRILDALEWQKPSADWIREDGRFIPAPYRYLDQWRWLDARPETWQERTERELRELKELREASGGVQ